jgi:hypothetical protein
MNSAQLVNLILAKLRRVEFVCIDSYSTEFVWNHKKLWAFEFDGKIRVRNMPKKVCEEDDNYSRRVEGILNGMVRNDAGELVPCEN